MLTTRNIYNKVLVNRTAIVKNTVAFLLMFVIFAFEGCFNFATLGWDFHKVLEPAYWVKVGTKIILFILVKSLALNVFIPVARDTNKDLFTAKTKNDELMKLKGRDFPYYIENKLNPQIKIEAWKKKVKHLLYKLEKRAKPEDRALYFSDKDVEKEHNKYCIRRVEYERELTDEYCKENINVLNVTGYAVIDPAVFDMPVTQERENKYKLTAKTRQAVITILAVGVLSLFVTQAIWNAVEISKLEEYNALAVWIGILMDLAFLIWNFFTGTTKAFTTVEDEEVLPYVNRNRILTEYLDDKTHNKENYEILMESIEKRTKKVVDEVVPEEKKEA